MNSSPPPIPAPEKHKNAGRKAWLIILAIVVILLSVFAGWHLWLGSKIHRRLASVRATREPVTLAELNQYYPSVPTPSNAAVIYGQAFELLLKSSSSNFLEHLNELPSGTNPLPLDLRKQMELAVAENHALLGKLEIAASLPSCRYPIDYRPGPRTLLPHLNCLRKCSSLQVCQGALREQRGDVRGAIDSIDLILRYSTSLNHEPDLISVLIQDKLFEHASELVRWLIDHRELSQSELKRLELILDDSDSTNRLQQALVGERCMVLDVFHQKARDILEAIDPGSENGLAVVGLYLLKATGKLKQDEIRFLDRTSEFRETLRLPLPERLDQADELRENISREAVPKKFILTGTMAPAFLKGIDRAARDLARKRSVEIALALERYRLNRRKYPSALSELVPEYLSQIPNDPFSDEPMHYSAHERGFIIYSVGPDRMDDGGQKGIRESPLKDTPTGDIIFSINR